jgi:hypothetical protein
MENSWSYGKLLVERCRALHTNIWTGALTHFGIMWRRKLFVTGLRVSTGEETWSGSCSVFVFQGWEAYLTWYLYPIHANLWTCFVWIIVQFLSHFLCFCISKCMKVLGEMPLSSNPPSFTWLQLGKIQRWIAPRCQCSTSTVLWDPVFSSSQSLRSSPPGAWTTRWH